MRARSGLRRADALLGEAVQLVGAIGLDVVFAESIDVKKPRADTLLGSGHVERIKDAAAEAEAPLVVVNTALSPVQQRNLETRTGCKVIDRTALILEIFGARAMTHAGRLQVELAALTFQRSRLVRSWTHLERQRGGGGFLGGPGERQIELDRRIIDERVINIKRELSQVERTRHIQRGNRRRGEVPTIALVGYTNAGKSTLFNRITGAGVLSRDMLFATLDPTMRQITLPSGRRAVLADTVGFISQLPTELVEAFKSTLEEVVQADLLVHVHDASSPLVSAEATDVHGVLGDLGLDEDAREARIVSVMNKADLLGEDFAGVPGQGREDGGEDYAGARAASAAAAQTEAEGGDQAAHDQAAHDMADHDTEDHDTQGRDMEGQDTDSHDTDGRNVPDRDELMHLAGAGCFVSARTGAGLDDVLAAIDRKLDTGRSFACVRVGPTDGAARAWLFDRGRVEVRDLAESGDETLDVSMDETDWARFRARWPALAGHIVG